METQMDIQTYLEQGRTALAQGQGREAAIAYAHGAQLEPDNPAVHLGLAEANLALGNYGVVQMACRRVQQLQPQGGNEAKIAQALQDLLDRRYERALQNVDAVIAADPGVPYYHSLRSYLLRALGQDYDAGLARARASRLSYGGRFENCFPELEKAPVKEKATVPSPRIPEQPASGKLNGSKQPERESVPTWSRPNNTMRRNIVRTRFFLNQNPGFITNVIVTINAVLFLLSLLNQDFYKFGAQINLFILRGEIWRLFTGIFFYYPDLQNNLLSTLIGMLSLFFIGRAVEIFYGQWRYVLIYLLSGIAGGIISLFLLPPMFVGTGPGGALTGVFAAIGVFYFVNRNALGGYGANAIGSWVFWVLLNLAMAYAQGFIVIELATLAVSLVISFLLLPGVRGRRLF